MDISHRKITKRIRFKDAGDNAIANRKICIKQTGHEFLFGCGAFDFFPYVMRGVEEYKEITDKWLEVFNYATLPFYWGMFEREEGKPDTEILMKTSGYLIDNNVKVKGHTLCWHTVCAPWLLEYDNQTIMKKQLERIEREVTDFKGRIDIWDVLNEAVIMPKFDKYDNAVTRICREKGRLGLIKETFEKAHECNPEATLILNDFNTSKDYADLIDECLNAGVQINAIGIQSHQHQGYWGKEKYEEVLDRFSSFGLPLHFTENTLVSGDLIPGYIEDLNDWQVEEWPSTPEGEERQAKEAEEIYRILFSHPLVKAVTNWDFRDGAWLKAPGGLIRKDNSIKPSYEKLKNLIRNEWWTDTEVITDSEGFVEIDAFKGDYLISCDDLQVAISLNDKLGDEIKFI